MANIPALDLLDGNRIPQLGLGTFKIDADATERVVSEALEIGYRHIDTAKIYGNEEGVGRAIAASGLPRHEVFVTTKLWNDDHIGVNGNGVDQPRIALERSLERLGLDRVDLYLVHWPLPMHGTALATWDEMVGLRESGLATSIGVCNFLEEHLRELLDHTEVLPVVDQIEQHPYLQQRDLRAMLDSRRIRTEAWGPIGQASPELLGEPAVTSAAAAHGVTPAQVVLRWHLQRETIVFPKSSSPERLRENFAVTEFELSNVEMQAITALDRGEAGRMFANPREFDRL